MYPFTTPSGLLLSLYFCLSSTSHLNIKWEGRTLEDNLQGHDLETWTADQCSVYNKSRERTWCLLNNLVSFYRGHKLDLKSNILALVLFCNLSESWTSVYVDLIKHDTWKAQEIHVYMMFHSDTDTQTDISSQNTIKQPVSCIQWLFIKDLPHIQTHAYWGCTAGVAVFCSCCHTYCKINMHEFIRRRFVLCSVNHPKKFSHTVLIGSLCHFVLSQASWLQVF